MNFSILDGAISEVDKLTPENQRLSSLYVEFANSCSLQKFYSDVITRYNEYITENLLLPNFLDAVKYESTMEEQNKVDVKVQVYSHQFFPPFNIGTSLKSSNQEKL